MTLEAANGRGPSSYSAVDDEGRFRLTGFAPGVRYRLRAWSKDRTRKAMWEAVPSDGGDLRVILEGRE